MANFIQADRSTVYLLPPSMQDWLKEDHLARFVVEVIDGLDLSKLSSAYAGRGSKAYHPSTLLALLVYGYATGVFSSRRLELATYDSVAFRYIAAGSHPDHDTLATFRRRFIDELGELFVQVLELASEMKLLKLGTVCVDGTKIQADASRHSALSYGHIGKLQEQLRGEVQQLLEMAEATDKAEGKRIPQGMNLPEELKRRHDRLAVMEAAKATIQARAQTRYEQEQAQHEERLAARADKEARTGRGTRGPKPQAPEPGARETDQVNLTDDESRIMKRSGSGGYEQSYNAQAGVDTASMLVVATGVTQEANDKRQIAPMLATLQAQQARLGRVEALIADTGYMSEANVERCEAAQIKPLIAQTKEAHNQGLTQRYEHGPEHDENENENDKEQAKQTALQRMQQRLKSKSGKAAYALRKQTVEPVFGIIKSVLGFRQFSLRGLRKVQGEWRLVCLAWNVKRMAVLRQKSVNFAYF
jgi:transposase